MTSTIPQENSQKLIRCTVEGRDHAESLRYIELDHYKLWAYMMLHKHGLKIKDASLWLWVNEQDFVEKKELYSHFQDLEKVNKIELYLFDELHGFTHTIYRFVLKVETDMVERVLLSHLSPELADTGNYRMNTCRGYCIKGGKNLKNMVLGLSGSDDRIWYRKK